MNLGTLTVTLTANTNGLQAATIAMQNLQKQSNVMTTKFNDNLKTMGMSLRSFGWLATTVLTMPMVLFGKATIEAYKTFEFNMQKIVGLAGITQKAVNGWSQSVLDMAPKVAKSAAEVSDALYYVASSGYKSDEALKITELSAKAAAAGLGETKDVANLVTSAMNAYKESNLSSAEALDILIVGVREGKVEAEGFAGAVQQVIPLAAEMSVSFDQVVGAMSAMSLTGSTAANTAVYLKQILASLKGPTIEAEKALSIMGTSSQELRKQLGEQGLFPTLMRIKEMTDKYGESMVDKVFPNIRAMIGFLSLMGENMEYNYDVMKKVANSTGALGEAWDAVANTAKVRLDMAVASLNVSFVRMGKEIATYLVPAFTWLSRKIEALSKWFTNLDESTKQFIVGALALVAALGPLSLVGSLLTYALRALNSVILIVVTSFTKFMQLLVMFQQFSMTNPWSAMITALAAIASYLLIINRRQKEWGKSEPVTVINPFEEDLKAGKKAEEIIQRRMTKIKEMSRRELGMFAEFITQAMTDNDNLIQKLKDADKATLEKANRELQTYISDSTRFARILQETSGKGESVFDSTKNVRLEYLVPEKKGLSGFKEGRQMKQMYEETLPLLEQTNAALIKQRGIIDSLNQNQIAGLTEVNGKWKESLKSVNDLKDSLPVTIVDPDIASITGEYDNQKKIIDDLAAAYKILGVEYDSNAEYTELASNTLKELIAKGLSPTDAIIQKLVSDVKKLNAELADTELLKEWLKTTQDFSKGWAEMKREQFKAFAGDFGYAKEVVDLKNFKLKPPTFLPQKPKLFGKEKWDMTDFFDKTKPFTLPPFKVTKPVEGVFKQEGEVLSEVNGELERMAYMSTFTGEATNSLSSQISVLIDGLNKLYAINKGKDESGATDALKEQLKALQTLENAQSKEIISDREYLKAKYQQQMEYYHMMGKDTTLLTKKYNRDKFKLAMEDAQAIAQIMATAVGAIATLVEAQKQRELSAVGQNAKAREAIEKKYFEKQKKMAIAQAIMNGAVGITNALSTGAPIYKWIEAAAVAASTAAQVAVIQAQKMAEGGIVPPGYSNDTYPALLTSGEVVVPPGKLENLNASKGQVVFKIEGRELVGILEKMDKYSRSY